jgi:carboxypeptidase C (cathepsin A)
MKYWILLISASLLLTACDGDSEESGTDGTFVTAEAAPQADAPGGSETDLPIVTVAPGGSGTDLPIVAVAPGNSGTDLPIKPVALVPPEDHVVEDKNVYSIAADASLRPAAVDETPAVKNHQTMIGGQLVKFTASAGHLIAYAPKDPKNPAAKAAQASIFYMAYTRQDLPKENRPVTFFWNGGPGNSSVWLHLGSWAPKRLKTGASDVVDSEIKGFSWIDNAETLLDKSDLVFVDPPGTGLSQAIAPYKNSDFWGMEADAQVNRDFVVSFVNRYNRQSSPKYLYGESYDGIRLPIVANLLAAGTGNLEPDKTGKSPVALSGLVLGSPILNMSTNCSQSGDISCAGYLPSYAMAADYHGKGTKRGTASALEYIDTLRKFVVEKYNPARKIWYSQRLVRAKAVYTEANQQYDKLTGIWPNAASSRDWAINVETQRDASSKATELAKLLVATPAERAGFIKEFMADPFDALKKFVADAKQEVERALSPAWRDYAKLQAGTDFFKNMTGITGLDADWLYDFEVSPIQFPNKLVPGSNLGVFDARVKISDWGSPGAALYTGAGFAEAIKSVLPDMFNYHSASPYTWRHHNVRAHWKFEREHKLQPFETGLPDLVATLKKSPSVKVLALHGYYDLLTPFHQTELDLAGAGLASSVPVALYEGGHMFFDDDKARTQAKRTLDTFYDGPPANATKLPVVLD